MTLRIALFLMLLHLIVALTTLAFDPGRCEDPSDVGCGTPAVTTVVENKDTSIGGTVLTTIWDGAKAIFGPLIGLISFDHPWLRIDGMPELADWLVKAGRTVLALLHVWVVYKTFMTALGRTT